MYIGFFLKYSGMLIVIVQDISFKCSSDLSLFLQRKHSIQKSEEMWSGASLGNYLQMPQVQVSHFPVALRLVLRVASHSLPRLGDGNFSSGSSLCSATPCAANSLAGTAGCAGASAEVRRGRSCSCRQDTQRGGGGRWADHAAAPNGLGIRSFPSATTPTPHWCAASTSVVMVVAAAYW